MATKKLTPVKQETNSVQDANILLELQKQTEYMHRMDWKLWMIMNMFKTVCEDNGYKVNLDDPSGKNTDPDLEV